MSTYISLAGLGITIIVSIFAIPKAIQYFIKKWFNEVTELTKLIPILKQEIEQLREKNNIHDQDIRNFSKENKETMERLITSLHEIEIKLSDKIHDEISHQNAKIYEFMEHVLLLINKEVKS